MNDFIELFNEDDLKDLNLEPIKKREIKKIVKSISNSPKKPHVEHYGKVYVTPEASKQLIYMMLNS